MPLIRPIIDTRTTAEWSADLEARDILHGPVHTHHDLFEDPQVNAVSALHWIEDRALGRVPMATLPGQPQPATGDGMSQSPALGAHSLEILQELGRSAAEIDGLIKEGAIGQPA